MDEKPATAARRRRSTRLTRILATACREAACQRSLPVAVAASEPALSIGAILDRAGGVGFGFVAALLALASIPLVGLTAPLGLAIAALGIQMTAGLSRPWLPRFITRRQISVMALRRLTEHMTPWGERIARVVRPRMLWLTMGPFWALCGIGILIQGISLTLPVPGADWLFVIPIVLYGVGLMERDGLLVLLCHILTSVQFVLALLLWRVVAAGFMDLYRWCAAMISAP